MVGYLCTWEHILLVNQPPRYPLSVFAMVPSSQWPNVQSKTLSRIWTQGAPTQDPGVSSSSPVQAWQFSWHDPLKSRLASCVRTRMANRKPPR